MKYVIFIFLFSVLFSCDGRIKVKIYSYENNSVEGVFYQDTLLTGNPIPDTDLRVYVEGHKFHSPSAINEFNLKTDSLGKFESDFAIPPLKKDRIFFGEIIAKKDGYKRSILKFKHCSVDSVICIFNMKRIE